MDRLAALDRDRGRLSGVLVVTRPGCGGIHPAALLVVCAAIAARSTDLDRVLARSDSSETTLFYSNLVGAVAITVAVPFYW